MLVDSHCHLDRLKLSSAEDALDTVLAAARANGVSHFLSVATDLKGYPSLYALTERYSDLHVSAGVHPLSDEIDQLSRELLEHAAAMPRCVAVGETGLDYHYQADTRVAQQNAFALHLQVAADLKKPVIVHTREAQADTLRLIREHGDPQWGGVLHCFTESWEMAKAALDLNYHISFSGIVTFRNAADLREVAKKVPLERLLVETDAPYLTPVPHRGKANEPCYVRDVAQCVADLKGVSLEHLAEQTTANFFNLFQGAR